MSVEQEVAGSCSSKKRKIGSKIPHDYFMGVACLSAKRSKDPRRKVGACIVNGLLQIVGTGYNGMPNGCNDSDLSWEKVKRKHRLSRENKNLYVCHAEMNAILNKNSANIKGSTLYSTLYPCNECAKLIILSGIREIIYLDYGKNEKQREREAAKDMFKKTGIDVTDFETLQPKKLDFKIDDYLEWSDYFMGVAHLSAKMCEDPCEQAGACIVNDENRIVGTGYNAFPNGFDYDASLGEKSLFECHAEKNAILNKNSANLKGCTLYSTLFPCNECTKIIIQSGITKIIHLKDDRKNDPKNIELQAAKKMLKLKGIEAQETKQNLAFE